MDLQNENARLKVKKLFGQQINPPVFWVSLITVILFVFAILMWLEQMEQIFLDIRTFISERFGWFYILTVNFLLGFCGYLFFGKYKDIRLGGDSAKPEFTFWQWFAMLFNAGIGLALMFYSLAEPMLHYSNPPAIEGLSEYPAQLAFGLTFFHWGIHGWAVYGMVGLTVAFFAYNRGFPLSLRSVLYPLIGDRIYGWMGHTVDIISTIATLFGLATTLGIGIQYMSAGIDYLFGLHNSVALQIILVAILTLAAMVSLILGLKKGIKNLSVISAWMAVVILVYVFLVGPTLFMVDSFIQNTGFYIQNLIGLGTWSDVFSGSSWQDEWTLFYWGWWFAWAPFVGIFVARISKGRSIREFIGGVILAPTLTIIIWVTILGGAGIYEELFGGGGIAEAINQDLTQAMFVLLERYPLALYSSIMVVVTGAVFFVTSSDSGSFVVVALTSSTDGDTSSKPQRVFWAVVEGIIACLLLLGGGLIALQTASLITGLPVAIVIIPMCLALLRELKKELSMKKSGSNVVINKNESKDSEAP